MDNRTRSVAYTVDRVCVSQRVRSEVFMCADGGRVIVILRLTPLEGKQQYPASEMSATGRNAPAARSWGWRKVH